MKSGEPPTARKARTGELTPPGKELQRLGEELVGARPDRAGHRGTAWSACATERAAPSPESMQSGMPTPR